MNLPPEGCEEAARGSGRRCGSRLSAGFRGPLVYLLEGLWEGPLARKPAGILGLYGDLSEV